MPRVAALILKDESIALIERRRNDELYYVFPGGQVEEGESLEETIVREVEEELGLLIKVHRLVTEVSYKGSIQYYFLVEAIGGEFGTGRGLEMTGHSPPESGTGSYAPVWMPIRALLQKPVYPRCVSEIIVKAMKEGWLKQAPRLHDVGRDFPHLLQDTTLGAAQCRFELRNLPPPANLISNVHLVPFIDDRCLIIRLQNGDWEIPGGTLEVGESYLDTIRRELLEEAGAQLLTFEILGAWRCRSSATKPYRPHLPHPEFYVVVGYGEVELVSKPKNPASGEKVVAVECVTIGEAIQRFLDIGRPDLAELYQLAAVARKNKS